MTGVQRLQQVQRLARRAPPPPRSGRGASAARCAPAGGSSPRPCPPGSAAAPPAAPRAPGAATARRRPRSSRSARPPGSRPRARSAWSSCPSRCRRSPGSTRAPATATRQQLRGGGGHGPVRHQLAQREALRGGSGGSSGTGPTSDSGGTTTFTRDPSASRASHSGDASSTRRPSGARIRSIACSSSAVGAERDRGRLDLPAALHVHRAGAVHHHLVHRRVRQQRLERAEPAGQQQHPLAQRLAGARRAAPPPRCSTSARTCSVTSPPPAAPARARSIRRPRSARARSSIASMTYRGCEGRGFAPGGGGARQAPFTAPRETLSTS